MKKLNESKTDVGSVPEFIYELNTPEWRGIPQILAIDLRDNTVSVYYCPNNTNDTIKSYEDGNDCVVITSAKHLALLRIQDPSIEAYEKYREAQLSEIHKLSSIKRYRDPVDDNRFNAKPEKSTYVKPVHRKSKRW